VTMTTGFSRLRRAPFIERLICRAAEHIIVHKLAALIPLTD
jgi:hypothetical protein